MLTITLFLALALDPAVPGKDMSDSLATIRAQHDVPGLAALVIDSKSILAWGVDGVRRRGAKSRLTIGRRVPTGHVALMIGVTRHPPMAEVAGRLLNWAASRWLAEHPGTERKVHR